MENDQRGHFARLLADVKGDPKTSAAMVAMLEAILGEVRSLRGQCDRCQDCGNTQGAALEDGEQVRAGLTDDESNAIGQVAAELATAENLPGGFQAPETDPNPAQGGQE